MLKKAVIFLFIPAGISLLLMGMYFSETPLLQNIVSPNIEGRKSDREFGLLENLQNVYLLIICFFCGLGFKRARKRWKKGIFLFSGILFWGLFLEEIDYGLHFYEHFQGIPEQDAADIRNLHNIGDTTNYLKKIADGGLICFFILFPLLYRSGEHVVLSSLRPSLWFSTTILLMFILSTITHYLSDIGLAREGTLYGNLSEFRELTLYYVFLVYFYLLVCSLREERH